MEVARLRQVSSSFPSSIPTPHVRHPLDLDVAADIATNSDNVNGAGRAIANPTQVTGSVSIESCTAACFNAGFGVSGTEFAEYVSTLFPPDYQLTLRLISLKKQ